MRQRAGSVVVVFVLAMAAGVGSAKAQTYRVIAPNYPHTGMGLISCEPWLDLTANTVTVMYDGPQSMGDPTHQVVTATAHAHRVTGALEFSAPRTFEEFDDDRLVIPVDYPTDTRLWPVDPVTNERQIEVSVAIFIITFEGTTIKLSAPKWLVRCPALPEPNAGV